MAGDRDFRKRRGRGGGRGGGRDGRDGGGDKASSDRGTGRGKEVSTPDSSEGARGGAGGGSSKGGETSTDRGGRGTSYRGSSQNTRVGSDAGGDELTENSSQSQGYPVRGGEVKGGGSGGGSSLSNPQSGPSGVTTNQQSMTGLEVATKGLSLEGPPPSFEVKASFIASLLERDMRALLHVFMPVEELQALADLARSQNEFHENAGNRKLRRRWSRLNAIALEARNCHRDSSHWGMYYTNKYPFKRHPTYQMQLKNEDDEIVFDGRMPTFAELRGMHDNGREAFYAVASQEMLEELGESYVEMIAVAHEKWPRNEAVLQQGMEAHFELMGLLEKKKKEKK